VRDAATQAASLAKADLVTDMVGEFAELQGIMGAYYARHDQLGDTVATAIEDHYKPRFAGDALPRNDAGLVVALADKIETLTGLFAVGERPTGDKDPFALRRHALGIIRMLMDKALPLSLAALVGLGMNHAPVPAAQSAQAAQDDLLTFFQERLAGLLREQQYSAREIDAVLSAKPAWLADVPKRLDAVRAFVALPEAESLAAANKRVANILKKQDDAFKAAAPKVDPSRLQDDAERQLHAMLLQVKPIADGLFHQGEYAASLRELATLKTAVDRFFDQVMVNAEDATLRHNRLALLTELHVTMNRVADLAKLAT
jgi:glycyl-tRNA synthetase beta chain